MTHLESAGDSAIVPSRLSTAATTTAVMDWPQLRPRASVFTVAHEPRLLEESLSSLLTQNLESWEWIVVLHGSLRWEASQQNPRVRLIIEESVSGVGRLKRLACSLALGEILIQLDEGDQLVPDALERIVATFDLDASVGFTYSDGAAIGVSGFAEDTVASTSDGWTIESTTVQDQRVVSVRSFEPTPHNVSHAMYTPQFGRAFRRTDYERSGGYDAGRDTLVDEDLLNRMFRHSKFLHIPACLDLTRSPMVALAGGPDAVPPEGAFALYDAAIEGNTQAWSERQGLLALDFAPAALKSPGYLGIGPEAGPDVDVVGDIQLGLDLPDSSVGLIRAFQVLQFLPDTIAVFNEIYRLLAHGGLVLTITPSTDGRGAFQDPRNVSYYNENSFWYVTDERYASLVPELSCRFQVSRLVTYFPDAWHEQRHLSYVCCNLIAIKDGPRQGGPLNV
jgi:SAM-dependent methyltransferase